MLTFSIGRKLCLYWSLTVAVVAGTLLAFTQSFLTFTILNFIVGAATAGIFPSAYVMGKSYPQLM